MQLKIMKRVWGEKITIYGAVEYAKEDPVGALWLAWELGESGIRAAYLCIKGAPKKADLTVNVGADVKRDKNEEVIDQIKAMAKR